MSLKYVDRKASLLSTLRSRAFELELEQILILPLAIIGDVTLSQVTEPSLASGSFVKWNNNIT